MKGQLYDYGKHPCHQCRKPSVGLIRGRTMQLFYLCEVHHQEAYRKHFLPYIRHAQAIFFINAQAGWPEA